MTPDLTERERRVLDQDERRSRAAVAELQRTIRAEAHKLGLVLPTKTKPEGGDK